MCLLFWGKFKETLLVIEFGLFAGRLGVADCRIGQHLGVTPEGGG